MNILLLTGQVPYPPQAGGALRTFGLIDGLHRAGHSIDLLTFIEPGQPDPASTPLASLCRQVIAIPAPHRALSARLRDLFLSNRADMQGRAYSATYEDALIELLRENLYDLIQIESLEMATYLPTIQAAIHSANGKARKPRLIYDSFNAEFDLQHLIFDIDRHTLARLPGALYSFAQWRRLTRFERNVCQEVDQVIAVSEADAVAFRRLAPGKLVAVIPNGIPSGDYDSAAKHSSSSPQATLQQLDLGPAALVFTGTMNYRPNVDAVLWFTDHILGEVSKAVPGARLFVVGNKPHGRLEALRQRPDVEITGYVQDVTPFLRSAAVYVAPLRMGSGTRLKLLQAMAAGCAIVSTSVGAQGLDVTSGQEMMLADDPESFARATIQLLCDEKLRERLAESARKLVCQKYDWSVIVPRLLKVYQELGLG